MKKRILALSVPVLGFAPFVALAQQVSCSTVGGSAGTVEYIICKVGDILSLILPILVVLGLLYFIWGVISYVIASDEEGKGAGRHKIIYGIIGLVVITALWGISGIIQRTFGLSGNATPNVPYINY